METTGEQQKERIGPNGQEMFKFYDRCADISYYLEKVNISAL